MSIKYSNGKAPNIPSSFKNHPILWLVIANLGKLLVFEVAVVYVNYLFGTYATMVPFLIFGLIYFLFQFTKEVRLLR